MSNDPSSTRPYYPPAVRQTPAAGYPTPPGIGGNRTRLGTDYLHHPLHGIYRRQIRGVRLRWLFTGCIAGGLMVFALSLLLSVLVYTRIPAVVQSFTGAPDLTVTLAEHYLNRMSAARLAGGYDTGVPGLSIRALNLNVGPDNRLDYQVEFHLDSPVGSYDLSATIMNQVLVEGERLAVNMVGDPQIGNLRLPLEVLPFNLKDEVAKVVNSLNNNMLTAELNQPLEASLSGANLAIEGVITSEEAMSIRLRER
jgi:hypothetical protein